MKLARWSLHFYRIPYTRQVVWSNAVEDSGLYALLHLVSDDGVEGIAEGTIKDTWSGVSPASLKAALEDVALPLVRNTELGDEKAVAAALARIPENRLAKALIDNACCTMRAAAARTPLWKLWGGRQEVEVCWTVTRRAPYDMALESAEYCRRYGFRTLKVKGGQGIETDLQALIEIRAAVGSQVALYVDANSAYRRDEAPDYVRKIADAGAIVAEDPSPLVPDPQFQALQQGSPVPILVDNTAASLRDAQLYLERGAKAVMLKPGRVGLSECRAVQKAVSEKACRTAIGIYAETALGSLITLQLQAPMAAEQSFFLMMNDTVSKLVPSIQEGKIRLPEEPNLAALVDWEAVKKHQP